MLTYSYRRDFAVHSNSSVISFFEFYSWLSAELLFCCLWFVASLWSKSNYSVLLWYYLCYAHLRGYTQPQSKNYFTDTLRKCLRHNITSMTFVAIYYRWAISQTVIVLYSHETYGFTETTGKQCLIACHAF